MERQTKQREAIKNTFETCERALSPVEVLEITQVEVPKLSIATVYRTLAALSEIGWLIRVEIPGEACRYERSGKEHHHFFVCRVCERAFAVHGCVDGLQQLTPHGFTLEAHDIVLRGLCSKCASSRR
ncbi:MAG: transcriptional repressor [Spirochaetaceae bacterium]|nr:MAG: transcriptional repressor [Spirochaetaceae bacterium]